MRRRDTTCPPEIQQKGVEREAVLEKHHEVFNRFKKWNGKVDAGFAVNFLGVKTRDSFYRLMEKQPRERFESPTLPAFGELYFEWIDLLEAVVAARKKFIMIELGAGYGRWLVNASAAVHAYHGSMPYTLIGVEPEPTHYKWMRIHFEDNAVPLEYARLIQAAASDNDGEVWFYVGRPDQWYGQAIASPPRLSWLDGIRVLMGGEVTVGEERLRRVKAVSLNGLLYPSDHVDLIDLDVQGAELVVLKSAAEQLDKKVQRVHIGTHSGEIEAGLRTLFQSLGWIKLSDYACGSESHTPWGMIKFGDGVQSWINPKLS